MSRGLRARMTVLVSLLAFLLAALAYGSLMLVVPRLVDAAVDDGLRQRAGELQADLEAGETVEDPLAQVLAPDGSVTGGLASGPLLRPAQVRAVAPDGLVTEGDAPGVGEVRLLAVPLATVDGGVLVVAARLAALEALTVRVAAVLAVVSGLLVVLSSAGAWFLVGAVLRPVASMTSAAARIGARPGSGRLPRPGTGDEVDRLALTFNDLLDRLEAGSRRERAFVDDASHELRTPLTVLRGELELAADEPDPALARSGVVAALGAVDRLSRLSDDLLVLARLDDGSVHRPARTSVEDLAHQLRETADGAPGLVVRMETVPAPGPPGVLVDPASLRRAVGNLLRNAQAAGAGEALVRLSRQAPGAGLVVSVEDDGPGFPETFLPRAFERFAQPERSRGGRGSGLGLAIVQACAAGHGGSAHADNASSLGGGRVVMHLPGLSGPSSPEEG